MNSNKIVMHKAWLNCGKRPEVKVLYIDPRLSCQSRDAPV